MHRDKIKPKAKFNEFYLVLAVALLIIAVHYFIKSPSSENAEKITEMIIHNSKISFASNGIIDNEKLEHIRNMDYYELKKDLNANSDFCIYIEEGNGNIILAKSSENLQKEEASCR